MTPHLAASWGYFDPVSNTFNEDSLAEFPQRMIPMVAAVGQKIGVLMEKFGKLKVGDVNVYGTLGDMQV
jgi:hypothetical protein